MATVQAVSLSVSSVSHGSMALPTACGMQSELSSRGPLLLIDSALDDAKCVARNVDACREIL
jgi:hypothetical protein